MHLFHCIVCSVCGVSNRNLVMFRDFLGCFSPFSFELFLAMSRDLPKFGRAFLSGGCERPLRVACVFGCYRVEHWRIVHHVISPVVFFLIFFCEIGTSVVLDSLLLLFSFVSGVSNNLVLVLRQSSAKWWRRGASSGAQFGSQTALTNQQC